MSIGQTGNVQGERGEGRQRPESSRRGFTLLEILIAILILGVVLSTVYVSYTGTLRVVKDLEKGDRIYSMARSALERMTLDLTAAGSADGTAEFTSRRDASGRNVMAGLTFVSAAYLNFDEADSASGAAKVEYYLEEDRESGTFSLLRRQEPLEPNPARRTAQAGYILCSGLRALAFRFYDSTGREFETWDAGRSAGGGKSMPFAVSVLLTFENPEDRDLPYRFMTKILLPSAYEGI